MKTIGEFEVVSAFVFVGDPCYSVGLSNIIDRVKNGTWEAEIAIKNGRVSSLFARHPSNRKNPSDRVFNVGVDSGQAGIFDGNSYRNDEIVEEKPEHNYDTDCQWYGVCCDKTLSEEMAGIIPFGCVSSSGYGDGEYNCLINRDSNGLCDAIMINFMEEDEDVDFNSEEYN